MHKIKKKFIWSLPKSFPPEPDHMASMYEGYPAQGGIPSGKASGLIIIITGNLTTGTQMATYKDETNFNHLFNIC